jgi:hypothetical protein
MKALPDVSGSAAVAVVGQEAFATARAALDLARAEARQRTVTVVDLIGDAPPLIGASSSHDGHGVADCFAYGLSFGAVARASTIDPRVSLIQSGTEPLDHGEILPSDRWSRLIARARESNTLLIFAALADTPSLETLTARVDHVIPAALVLAPAPLADGPPSTQAQAPSRSRSPRQRVLARPPIRARRPWAITGAIACAGVVALVIWIAMRPASPPPTRSTADTLTSTAQLAVNDRAASGAGSSAADAALIDPEDSASAAAYAVRVGSYPTFESALRDARLQVKHGAATISPLAPAGSAATSAKASRPPGEVFVVFVGAAKTAVPMDSAMHAWARAGGFGGGVVTRTPFALRLTEPVSADSARRATVTWRGRGIPVYALVDDQGRASVYAGAFASIDQTAPLIASLHRAGLAPSVAYRVGVAP